MERTFSPKKTRACRNSENPPVGSTGRLCASKDTQGRPFRRTSSHRPQACRLEELGVLCQGVVLLPPRRSLGCPASDPYGWRRAAEYRRPTRLQPAQVTPSRPLWVCRHMAPRLGSARPSCPAPKAPTWAWAVIAGCILATSSGDAERWYSDRKRWASSPVGKALQERAAMEGGGGAQGSGHGQQQPPPHAPHPHSEWNGRITKALRRLTDADAERRIRCFATAQVGVGPLLVCCWGEGGVSLLTTCSVVQRCPANPYCVPVGASDGEPRAASCIDGEPGGRGLDTRRICGVSDRLYCYGRPE